MKYFALVSLVLIGSQAVGGGQVLNNSELDGNELLKGLSSGSSSLGFRQNAGFSRCQ